MRYHYSPKAEEDLIRIQDEIFEASRDKEITGRSLTELMDKVEKKADYPRSGAPLYWLDRFTGYYYVVFKAYIAFYYPSDEGIRIERILHVKNDYMKWIIPRPDAPTDSILKRK